MPAMINCPYCGKLTDPKLENCPHCGGPMRTKAPGPPKRAATAPHYCPNCGSAVQDGDIICVRCGTNLLTGQKIAEERRPPAAAATPRRWPWLIAAGVVAVAVIMGMLLFVLAQDPLTKARDLSAQGNVLEALNVLSDHVAKHADDAKAHKLLGSLYWQAGQFPNAAEAFGKASTLDPEDTEAAMYHVVALSKSSPASTSQQIETLRRVVEAEPNNVQARYLLGLAQGAAGQYQQQVQTLEAVPAEGAETGHTAMVGVAHALDEDYANAEQTLTQAVQAHPESGDAVAALGLVAYDEGNLAEATARLEEALQKGSSVDMLVRTRLGAIYMGEGKFDAALPLLETAKDARIAAPDAPFYYALCLEALGKNAEALIEFERIASGATDYADEAAAEMVALYLAQGVVDRAENALQNAQSGGQTSPKLLTLKGQIQASRGELVDAQQSFQQAIQMDASYPAAHLEQGLLYVQREVLPDGIRELERYLELVGDDPAATRRNEIELLVTQLKQTVES
ncbi:MAG: tetratricopeptide repeat protein [Candidatus Hydrogenedentes bacterium]|nr:tetratricopeptide repeat protein [Candidatus Hydrogenedentota bacterium]